MLWYVVQTSPYRDWQVIVFTSVTTETRWICDLVFSVWVDSSWENFEILFFVSLYVAKWLGVMKWIMFDYFTGDKDSAHFCTHSWGYVFCLSKDNRGNNYLKKTTCILWSKYTANRCIYLLPLSTYMMQKLRTNSFSCHSYGKINCLFSFLFHFMLNSIWRSSVWHQSSLR